MPADVRDLLAGAVDGAGAVCEPDVQGAWRRGRKLRHRRIGAALVAAVLVLGAVGSGALLLAGGGSGRSVDVADATDGWTTYRDDAHGFSVKFPPGWTRDAGWIGLSTAAGATPLVAVTTGNGPDGITLSVLELPLSPAMPPRPAHFDGTFSTDPGGHDVQFTDQGRAFSVHVQVGASAPPTAVAQASAILDTLQFDPLGGTLRNDEVGVAMAIPYQWNATTRPLNHPPTDPVNALTAGTYELRADPSSYLPATAAQDLGPTDVLVFVMVRTFDAPDPSTPPRPAHFDAAGGNTSRAVEGIGDIPHGVMHAFIFQEHGREVYADVVVGDSASPARQAEAFAALDSLVIDPPRTPLPATTTTLPAPPPPPATFASGSPEADVATAFLGWTDTKPLDAKAPYIDGYDQIKATMAEADANAPPGLEGLHGVIESVTIIDATHAHVVYGFYNNSAAIITNLPGDVVRVGGKWKVTRATVCASFALGGVHCPPGTG
jgi:hypothetical protein